MTIGDDRVRRGTAAHLERWREKLAGGEERIGWKIGLNPPAAQQAAGIEQPVVGHLTSSTVMQAGGSFPLAGRRVVVEPEVAVRVGAGGDIATLGAALELVEPDRPLAELEAVLAGNIFHRGVVFGPETEHAPLEGLSARVLHNGEERATVDAGAAVGDPAALVRLVADTLTAHGEQLRAGDRVICGTLTKPLEVADGDSVALDLGRLGAVELSFED